MVLAALVIATVNGQMNLGQLRAFVPSDLRLPKMPPPEQNGWEAAMVVASLQTGRKNSPNLIDLTRQLDRAPSPETMKSAKAAVDFYRKETKLLEAALARPQWTEAARTNAAFPPYYPDVFTNFPKWAGLRLLSRVLILRSKLHFCEGNPELGLQDLALARQLAYRLMNGGNQTIVYLVGRAIEETANRALLVAIERHGLSDEQMFRIQAELLTQNSLNPLDGALRREFDNRVVQMPSFLDLRENREALSDVPRRLRTPLLQAHSFDRIDTIRTAIPIFRLTVLKSQSGFRTADDIQSRIDRLAPPTPSWAKGMPDSMRLNSKPTRLFIAWSRQHPNALGRMYLQIALTVLPFFDHLTRNGKADRLATITLLALHRYRTRHPVPAPNLATLVQEGLLPNLPVDPYGRFFQYDPVRQVIWSRGNDGFDNGGKNRPRTRQPDLVWSFESR